MERYSRPTVSICLTLGCTLSSLLAGCNSVAKKTNDAKISDTPPPKMLAPSVRKTWIPGQLKDGGLEWEEPHFIYRIERGATWSR